MFDNADNKPTSEQGSGRRHLLDYLPRSTQGSIIFTIRDYKTAVKLTPQNVVEVSEMNKEASKELLQKCLLNPHLTDTDNNTKALLAQTGLPTTRNCISIGIY